MTDKCLAREKHKPFKSLIVDINLIYFIIIFAILLLLLAGKVKIHSHIDISIKESKAITYKIQPTT